MWPVVSDLPDVGAAAGALLVKLDLGGPGRLY